MLPAFSLMLRCTVLCESFEPPLISLYFAREMRQYVHVNTALNKKRVCIILANIWFDHCYSSTPPELS